MSRTTTIGELCEVQSGGTPSRSVAEYWDGQIPWVKISDMLQGVITSTDECITQTGLDNSSAKVFPAGTLLLSIFATIGRTAVLAVPASTNQAIAGLRVKDRGQVDAGFLRRYLDFKAPTLADRARGVAQANINLSILRSTEVRLPPLPEQRRIAAILDQADALRAKRRQAIAKLDQLLQSVFLEMFGDPVTNPKGWPQGELHELADATDRINYGVVQPGEDFPAGIPLVRVGDIDGGVLSTASIKRISLGIESAFVRSRLKGNELLVSCVGSIGVIADVPMSAKGFNIARAITRVPLANPKLKPFVREMLKTHGVQRYFVEKTRTVSQPTLNVEFVKTAPVIHPPTHLQERFGQLAHHVEEQIQHQHKSATAADALLRSLQADAFAT